MGGKISRYYVLSKNKKDYTVKRKVKRKLGVPENRKITKMVLFIMFVIVLSLREILSLGGLTGE